MRLLLGRCRLREAAKKGSVLRPVPYKFTARHEAAFDPEDATGAGERGSSIGRASQAVATMGKKLAARAMLKAVGLGDESGLALHRGEYIHCIIGSYAA